MIVIILLDRKPANRKCIFFCEGFVQRATLLSVWHEDGQRLIRILKVDIEAGSKPCTEYCQGYIPLLQGKVTIQQYTVDICYFPKGIIHSLQCTDVLAALVIEQCCFFKGKAQCLYLRPGLDCGEFSRIRREVFSFDRIDLEVSVDRIVEALEQIFKSIKHREDQQQCCSTNRYPKHRDTGDDIDGLETFLAQDISPGNEHCI